jgi:hypothetical protein
VSEPLAQVVVPEHHLAPLPQRPHPLVSALDYSEAVSRPAPHGPLPHDQHPRREVHGPPRYGPRSLVGYGPQEVVGCLSFGPGAYTGGGIAERAWCAPCDAATPLPSSYDADALAPVEPAALAPAAPPSLADSTNRAYAQRIECLYTGTESKQKLLKMAARHAIRGPTWIRDLTTATPRTRSEN